MTLLPIITFAVWINLYCCEKIPWPSQHIEGRICLAISYRKLRVHHGRKCGIKQKAWWQKLDSENSHFEKCKNKADKETQKWCESLSSQSLPPVTCVLQTMLNLLSLPKQHCHLVVKCSSTWDYMKHFLFKPNSCFDFCTKMD